MQNKNNSRINVNGDIEKKCTTVVIYEQGYATTKYGTNNRDTKKNVNAKQHILKLDQVVGGGCLAGQT